MRLRFLPVFLATFLMACGDGDAPASGAVEDAAPDVSAGDDTAAPPEDSTAPDAGGEAGDDAPGIDTGAPGTDTNVAADTRADTATPMCIAAGTACSSSIPCCPGNKCISGLCRGCVAKGGFCTWAGADRCCSGSCDGDSCNGYKVGEACSSNSQCQLNNCVGGVCACAIGDAPCGSGGACTDIEYNDAHCGACGKACGPNQRCLAGKCECRDTFTTNCGADCYDTRIEEAHCGACGTACRSDQLCRLSVCTCATGTECSGKCVQLGSDPLNCGSCGKVCPADHPRCFSGACVCATGLTQCSTGCMNLQTDRTNCGSCGNTCSGMRSCVGGVCT